MSSGGKSYLYGGLRQLSQTAEHHMKPVIRIIVIVLLAFSCACDVACNNEKDQQQVVGYAIAKNGNGVLLYDNGTYAIVEDTSIIDLSPDDKNGENKEPNSRIEVLVEDVIDGDTYIVSLYRPVPGMNEQETVRLLGVDAPELNNKEYFSYRSREYAATQIKGKVVELEIGERPRDVFCRLLAYVYYDNDSMLNREMLEDGYCRIFPRKYHFHYDEFMQLQEEAITKRVGLWAVKAGTVHIAYIHNHKKSEHVIISNATDSTVDVSLWVVVDKSGIELVIPKNTYLEANMLLKLYSGDLGVNEPPGCYYLSHENIWNNDSDEALLLNSEGVAIDQYSY
ncbi:MAG: thermonuclease family protein [Bacteroidales bacterium]|nr:thermonuclease family protein [Candidatus Latescibacterota bacterium]